MTALSDGAVMMLEGLYEEELGIPSDHWKVTPDDGAYKDWNHFADQLKKAKLITAPTRKQIYASHLVEAPPMRITAKGKAEYERIKATPEYARIKADWERQREAWRQAIERSDAAFAKRTKGG